MAAATKSEFWLLNRSASFSVFVLWNGAVRYTYANVK